MRIQIEQTDKIVQLSDASGASLPARAWQGITESGIPCFVFVTRIAVAKEEDTAQFEAELQEQRAPSAELDAFPARMIL